MTDKKTVRQTDDGKRELVIEKEDGTVEVRALGKRTPIYAQKAVGLKPRPGYTARLVVEKPGRVEKFLEAGYEFVSDKSRMDTDNRLQTAQGLGEVCRQVVNKHNLSHGDSPYGVWMEIPTELYEEDQRAKLERSVEIEQQIDPRNIHKHNPDVYYTSTYKKTLE